MNRMLLLAGTALLALSNVAVPAHAAHKHARQYSSAPVQQERFGKGVRGQRGMASSSTWSSSAILAGGRLRSSIGFCR